MHRFQGGAVLILDTGLQTYTSLANNSDTTVPVDYCRYQVDMVLIPGHRRLHCPPTDPLKLDTRDDGPAFTLDKVEDPADPTDVDVPATADDTAVRGEHTPVVITIQNWEIVSPLVLVKRSVVIGDTREGRMQLVIGSPVA
jgi:hypothetical protein